MFAPGTPETRPSRAERTKRAETGSSATRRPGEPAYPPGVFPRASDHTKARYAFVYGDFRRLHRMGIIACHYRAAEWRHKEIELAAHDLLQRLDRKAF